MDNFAIFGINKGGVIILNRICERKRAKRLNGFLIKNHYMCLNCALDLFVGFPHFSKDNNQVRP
jgi:hypothetical protein